MNQWKCEIYQILKCKENVSANFKVIHKILYKKTEKHCFYDYCILGDYHLSQRIINSRNFLSRDLGQFWTNKHLTKSLLSSKVSSHATRQYSTLRYVRYSTLLYATLCYSTLLYVLSSTQDFVQENWKTLFLWSLYIRKLPIATTTP
jgi:hypothetical protein